MTQPSLFPPPIFRSLSGNSTPLSPWLVPVSSQSPFIPAGYCLVPTHGFQQPFQRPSISRWYPDIRSWLQMVDNDPNRNNQPEGQKMNYSQYSDTFIEVGVNYINQLLTWDHDILVCEPFNLLLGPAKDLLGWVAEDVALIDAGYSLWRPFFFIAFLVHVLV